MKRLLKAKKRKPKRRTGVKEYRKKKEYRKAKICRERNTKKSVVKET